MKYLHGRPKTLAEKVYVHHYSGMSFDLHAPLFGTRDLLACVPGLAHETFRAWTKRHVVLLSDGLGAGRGHRPLFRGSDVIQVALTHELSQQGLFVSKAKLIWLNAVLPRLNARRFPMASDPTNVSALLTLDPAGELLMWTFNEADDDAAGLAHSDAPHLAVLLRTDLFLDRMIQQMETVLAGGSKP